MSTFLKPKSQSWSQKTANYCKSTFLIEKCETVDIDIQPKKGGANVSVQDSKTTYL